MDSQKTCQERLDSYIFREEYNATMYKLNNLVDHGETQITNFQKLS